MTNQKENENEALKKALEGIGTLIEPDEVFRFHCTQCGECCRHRTDIIMSPYDLYNAAKYLNMDIGNFIRAYCEAYIGSNSKLPVVRLKPVGADEVCPLLVDNKCKIHEAKPFICAAYPIGRIHASSTKYVVVPYDCGDDSEEHTVREWFASNNIPLTDEWNDKWYTAITSYSQLLNNDLKAVCNSDIAQTLYEALFVSLYLDYDMGQEFAPQFTKHLEDVDALFENLQAIMES